MRLVLGLLRKRLKEQAEFDFDFLEVKGIGPGIKIKRGASGKAQGSWARRPAAREFLKDEKG